YPNIDITSTATNLGATVKVNGVSVDSGEPTSITLAIGENIINIVVTATDEITTSTYTIVVTREGLSPSYLAFDVLGQIDELGDPTFTTSDSDNASSTIPNNLGLNYPEGVTLDASSHRLFVSDSGNDRILQYDLDDNNNLIDYIPDHVLGQSDFFSKGIATTQAGLAWPTGLAYDSGNNFLFVADSDNNRVIIYDFSSGIVDGMEATYVLGQPDFVTQDWDNASSNDFNWPMNLVYDSDNKLLFLADGNPRILVFDFSSGITNDMEAAHVLGQADFYSTTPLTTQDRMSWSWALGYDDLHDRLFVNDDGNNRLLIFELASGITDGMPASYVLGQPDFETANFDTISQREASRYFAESLAYDSVNDRLFSGDYNDNRVLIFDLSQGITNYMNASSVIGQSDFISGDSGTSQYQVSWIELGMDYDSLNNQLFMTDNGNNRVLIWKFVKVTTSSLPDGTIGSSYSSSLSATSTQGVLSWSVDSGELPDGLSLDAETGGITGIPTDEGEYTFIIKATDTFSETQTFTDIKSFVITVGTGALDSSDSSLSDLFVNQGTLVPTFTADIFDYTANVANAIDSVSITPTANDDGATITVNDIAVASGDSVNIDLAVDENTINIVVTAEDDSNSTYEIIFTRAAPPAPIPVAGGSVIINYNPPKPPEGGFSILINNDAISTQVSNVTLNLNGGPNASRMAISNFSNFEYIGQENYISTKEWNLCSNNLVCSDGSYTVYVKYYTSWGYTSNVISDSIILKNKLNK
ncbi:MAG: cadherin-like beta sandwich domain-containing protein, partial [Patescibacteria group bacterium]